ncbi:hypothetical protein [Cupriavidus sp. SK-4]|uniref:hypothetical protein n=1 Tax=Cupriavidus sp. SK-4 TaxID=574750 RepID=UPI001267B057|nr:hypothetical protein [Cupriavidus sp. SK-4]
MSNGLAAGSTGVAVAAVAAGLMRAAQVAHESAGMLHDAPHYSKPPTLHRNASGGTTCNQVTPFTFGNILDLTLLQRFAYTLRNESGKAGSFDTNVGLCACDM